MLWQLLFAQVIFPLIIMPLLTSYHMLDIAMKETKNLTAVTEFLHSYCSPSIQHKYQWWFSLVSRGSLSSNRVYLFHHVIKQQNIYKKDLFIQKSSHFFKHRNSNLIYSIQLYVKTEENSLVVMYSKELRNHTVTATILNRKS